MKNLKSTLVSVINFILSIFNHRLVKNGPTYKIEQNIFFDEKRVYRHFFKSHENLTIVDIGGHIGQSVKLFSDCYNNSKIYSFEPVSDSFKTLEAKFGGNPKVHLRKMAVSNAPGTIEINILGDSSTGNSAVKPTGGIPYTTESVETICLDDFFKTENLEKINILKIDTQGFEKECLEGSLELLQNSKIDIIKVEIMLHRTYDRETSFRVLEEILHKYNYRLYDICSMKKSSQNSSTLLLDAIYLSPKMQP